MTSDHNQEIEERIRTDFQMAFDELERAPESNKAEANEQLNRAMRRLYDFVAYGRMPADLQMRPSAYF